MGEAPLKHIAGPRLNNNFSPRLTAHPRPNTSIHSSNLHHSNSSNKINALNTIRLSLSSVQSINPKRIADLLLNTNNNSSNFSPNLIIRPRPNTSIHSSSLHHSNPNNKINALNTIRLSPSSVQSISPKHIADLRLNTNSNSSKISPNLIVHPSPNASIRSNSLHLNSSSSNNNNNNNGFHNPSLHPNSRRNSGTVTRKYFALC